MSISSRITAMEEHIENAYNKLEDLGTDLTNVNKNINNIASKIEQIYEDSPKVIKTGFEITLNGVKNGKMVIQPKGNTTQESGVTPDTPKEIKAVKDNNIITITQGNTTIATKQLNLGNIKLEALSSHNLVDENNLVANTKIDRIEKNVIRSSPMTVETTTTVSGPVVEFSTFKPEVRRLLYFSRCKISKWYN